MRKYKIERFPEYNPNAALFALAKARYAESGERKKITFLEEIISEEEREQFKPQKNRVSPDTLKDIIHDSNHYLFDRKLQIHNPTEFNGIGMIIYRGGIIILPSNADPATVNKESVLKWFLKKSESLPRRLFRKSLKQDFLKRLQPPWLSKGYDANPLSRALNGLSEEEQKQLKKRKENWVVGAFTVDNLFHGELIDDMGNSYDKNSIALEINGIRTSGLKRIAKQMARDFNQKSLIFENREEIEILIVSKR